MGNSCFSDELANANFKDTPKFIPRINRGKVIKVCDGDTLWIASKYGKSGEVYAFKCRLYGLNCAESKKVSDKEKELSSKAKEFTTEFCLNKIVNIEVSEDRDLYGRLLIKLSKDGIELNKELLKRGLAIEYFGGHKKALTD